jgi:preprotein translocase subunit SecA
VGEPTEVQSILDTVILKATDDQKAAIMVNAENFKNNSGDDIAFLRTARGVMLQTIDLFWIDHLESMDYMRSSVNLRAYGQRDPLVEYKREGLRLFKTMEDSVDQEIIRILTSVQGQVDAGQNLKTIELRPSASSLNAPSLNTPSGMVEQAIRDAKAIPIISGQEKVGRNDLCPCGSGKKYKKCHGV